MMETLEFEQYQQLSNDSERRAFWHQVEQEIGELSTEERLAAQAKVRANIDQLLQRMEAIATQLTASTENVNA